jgi:hypothetical protein
LYISGIFYLIFSNYSWHRWLKPKKAKLFYIHATKYYLSLKRTG